MNSIGFVRKETIVHTTKSNERRNEMKQKRMLAILLLVTIFTMVTTVAFAGQNPSNVCPVCYSESYGAGNIVITNYAYYDGFRHSVYYYVPQVCSRCAHRFNATGSYEEWHEGDPCVKCNYPNYDK